MAGGGVASEFDPIHIVQLTLDEMKAAVDVATDYGTYLLAHTYHNLSVNRCIDAGVKYVEHGFLMGEATMERMTKDTLEATVERALGQFTSLAAKLENQQAMLIN